MNTKTLDNTANDPWADIAHSDLVNYVRNTGHFPADGYQTPKPLTDQQNVNTIIITIIAIFLNRSEQGEWRETSHWTTSFPFVTTTPSTRKRQEE